MENFILCAVKAFNWSHDFQAEDKLDNNTLYRKGHKKSRLFVYDQIIAINQFDQSNAIKIFSYNKFSCIWCILIKHLFLLIKKASSKRTFQYFGWSRAAATSKMERVVIIVNGWKPLTIITKHSILDVAEPLDSPLHILRKMVRGQVKVLTKFLTWCLRTQFWKFSVSLWYLI